MLHTASGGTVDPGGSTITQQLAKTLYVGEPDTLIGRLRAIGLAFKLEHHYPKLQILDMYLNAIYFGHGFYGVQSASLGYFGREADQLSWAQATVLAGLPQAPSAFDPLRHLASAETRQSEVLRQLVRSHAFSARAARAVLSQPLKLRHG